MKKVVQSLIRELVTLNNDFFGGTGRYSFSLLGGVT
jgi:hypothetical protein